MGDKPKIKRGDKPKIKRGDEPKKGGDKPTNLRE